MYFLLKSLHIFFIVSWFAGLFYLPRLYVNLAMTAPDSPEHKHLLIMANKLYKFMQPWAIGALVCGLALLIVQFGFKMGWGHGKILIGVLLLGYQHYCGKLLRDFQHGRNTRSHKWFRVFNELPVFTLIAAIWLAIYKPF